MLMAESGFWNHCSCTYHCCDNSYHLSYSRPKKEIPTISSKKTFFFLMLAGIQKFPHIFPKNVWTKLSLWVNNIELRSADSYGLNNMMAGQKTVVLGWSQGVEGGQGRDREGFVLPPSNGSVLLAGGGNISVVTRRKILINRLITEKKGNRWDSMSEK